MAGSAWTNQVQNQVIIAGTSGQLLVYSPVPGAGNLISSISARAFTDPYGNAVLRGVVDYFKGVTCVAVQLDAGSIEWYTAGTEAGPWTAVSQIVQNLAGTILTITAPSVTFTNGVNAITAIHPGTTTTAETWQSMPAFNANFAHGSPVPSYKLNVDDTVSFAGEVTVAAGTTSGTVVTLSNSGYFPASVKKFAVPISAGTPATTANVQVTVDTSGNIILSAGPASGANYNFAIDCVRYPLDF